MSMMMHHLWGKIPEEAKTSAEKPDTVLVGKEQKTALIEVAITGNNSTKEQHKSLEKY